MYNIRPGTFKVGKRSWQQLGTGKHLVRKNVKLVVCEIKASPWYWVSNDSRFLVPRIPTCHTTGLYDNFSNSKTVSQKWKMLRLFSWWEGSTPSQQLFACVILVLTQRQPRTEYWPGDWASEFYNVAAYIILLRWDFQWLKIRGCADEGSKHMLYSTWLLTTLLQVLRAYKAYTLRQ